MNRITTSLRGREFRDTYLDMMASRFPAAAVDRKRRAWDWLFDGPYAQERPTQVFVVERDGAPAGAFLLLPSRYVIDGADGPAMHPTATVVRPDQTGVGPLMLDAQLHVDGRLAIGVPNRLRLTKAYTRYGGMLSPMRVLRQKAYRPGTVLANRGKLPGVLSGLVDAAAWAPRAASGLGAARLRRDERIDPIEAFGVEFDDAWTAAAPSIAFAQVRSAAFLNWRYREMPLQDYEALALRRGGALAGYAVLALQEAPGGRVGRVVDLFAYGGGGRDFSLLLAACDARFRRAGCAFSEVSFAPDAAIDAAARRSGFLRRKDMLPMIMRHDVPEVNAKLPELVQRIHFCRGDHDEDY